jgi:hypothetical protein
LRHSWNSISTCDKPGVFEDAETILRDWHEFLKETIPDLAAAIQAWATLREAIKAAMGAI